MKEWPVTSAMLMYFRRNVEYICDMIVYTHKRINLEVQGTNKNKDKKNQAYMQDFEAENGCQQLSVPTFENIGIKSLPLEKRSLNRNLMLGY